MNVLNRFIRKRFGVRDVRLKQTPCFTRAKISDPDRLTEPQSGRNIGRQHLPGLIVARDERDRILPIELLDQFLQNRKHHLLPGWISAQQNLQLIDQYNERAFCQAEQSRNRL